jgi:hypothetical protein
MPTVISTDNLMSIARQAASEFLSDGTNLTSAVVKQASASRLPLTEEHVRRICEMTYHEAFERSFHQKRGSLDRYISFDPPDAVQCAKELKAMAVEKKASSPDRDARPLAPVDFLKAASVLSGGVAREKYEPVNAFLATVLTAEGEKVAQQDLWHNPLGDVARAHQALREAARKVELDATSAAEAAKVAMASLHAQANQACKDGADVSDVLDLCYHSAATTTVPAKIAHDIVCEIAEALHVHGFDVRTRSKTASAEPNLAHPLAAQFAKVASRRAEQINLELALEDLRTDLRLSSTKIRNSFV